MATRTVTGTVYDISGAPLEGKRVKINLLQLGAATDLPIYPQQEDPDPVLTDALGEFSIDLWPNGDSEIKSIYEVVFHDDTRAQFILQDVAGSIDISDLIINHGPESAPQEPNALSLKADRDAGNLTVGEEADWRLKLSIENVDNTSDADKPVSTATQAAIDTVDTDISDHIADLNNPHQVTAVQVGVQNGSGGGQVGFVATATTGGAVGDGANASTGGAVGASAIATTGGAVGDFANATKGGAVGDGATVTTGGAVGNFATATTGGAVGASANASTGGAVGNGAIATTGFAGGAETIATTGGAVGDGAGTTTGGAVGFIATATTGGAAGNGANASTGGAVGASANASTGGAVGNGAIATTGGAVGSVAFATTGGAVGADASATTGGAVGTSANASTGGAVGAVATVTTGGAVGNFATATTGGAVGASANASTGGAAGNGAIATTGGAVGNFATATTGGAVGSIAFATTGGAVGLSANATTGGAVGEDATATTGFAGGAEASAIGTGRVQLGTGTNSTDSTIQFLSSGSVTADEFGTLAGATASYTTAEESKLAGIEALADVTDATNVAAAGGYIAGGTDVAIADGGTGASTEATARANLGFDANITSGTTPVTTTSYTPLSTDRVLLVDDTTAGGAVTINLPSAATIGDGWRLVVKKVGTDYDVTLDGDGTETIDGVLTRALHQKNDTFVIVSDGANWEIASRNIVLGWANYVDSNYTPGSPLLLNLGNSYNAQCRVDGLGSGSTQSEWPDGVPEPWAVSPTDKLIGTNDGDKFTYELSFKAQDGAASVLMDVYIDIGSPIGEISRSSVSIAKGASVETAVEMYRTYFTGSTFVANGGTIYFDTSQTEDDMSIWDIALLIEKTHVAS